MSPLDSIELGRFVLLDSVPANGENWFLTAKRSSACEATGWQASWASVMHNGRNGRPSRARGICCQATAATYLGRTEPITVRLLSDGTVFNDCAIQKIRSGEHGWLYAAVLLERFGAAPAPRDGREDWLRTWLPRLTRRLATQETTNTHGLCNRARADSIHCRTRRTEDC